MKAFVCVSFPSPRQNCQEKQFRRKVYSDPWVSEFWSVVTNLYRCGPMKADAHGSECMWQRGLFTSGRRKQGREGKESREPTSWGFYYLTPPSYVSYQTFSSWPLGDISNPNFLSFMSILCKNTSCLHSRGSKALTVLVLLKSPQKIKANS